MMIEALRATLWRLKIKCHKQNDKNLQLHSAFWILEGLHLNKFKCLTVLKVLGSKIGFSLVIITSYRLKMGAGRTWWFGALLVLFSFAATRSRAADTMTPGQTLFDNQTIVSRGGIFELGFFRPGNSQKYFIGIWYKRISQRAVVWVANRDKPIYSISNSELRISDDGNLVLTQSRILIWSSDATSSISGSTVAVLLDSGNLVLRSRINSSDVLWQSFDHPTDTWLPNQLFGFDRITGEYRSFISWRNRDDPSTGLFRQGLDPNGTDQFFLWRNGTKYWGSGLWDADAGTFVGFSGMEKNNYLSYHHVSDERGNYFTYTRSDHSSFSRIVMDFTGQSKLTVWSEESQQWLWVCLVPSNQCAIPYLCGGFSSCNAQNLAFCGCLPGFEPRSSDWYLGDFSGGCVRRTPLQCSYRNSSYGENDRFLLISNIQLPVSPWNLPVGTAKDCELACLNNCSCTAYSYNGMCLIWNSPLYDLKQVSGSSSYDALYLRLAASEIPNNEDTRKQRSTTGIAIGAAVCFVVLLLIATVLFWKFRTKCLAGALRVTDGTLAAYRYKDLQKATNNFSEIIGSGGFGTVFKGTLPDSTAIAVKKLGKHVLEEKQFRAELSTIGLVRHVNLVLLRGFCSEGSERLLVYDYMPNGSLGFQLFQNERMVLDWSTRYRIALRIARGLAYLHENCRDCIIHCDVKPENVLLDQEFSPKLADFGMAKLVGREFSKVLTTLRGTLGYLAPEWISGLAITQKADVYSYGMMILELISGRRNAMQSEDGSYSFFPVLAAERVERDDIVCLLDYKLAGRADINELRNACRVALWCIQDEEQHRPMMGRVVQILEGLLEVDIPPIPRSLYCLVSSQNNSVLS